MLEIGYEKVGKIMIIREKGKPQKSEYIEGEITEEVIGFTFYEKGEANVFNKANEYISQKDNMHWSTFFASPLFGSIYREIPGGIHLAHLVILFPLKFVQDQHRGSTTDNSLILPLIYPQDIYVDLKQRVADYEVLNPALNILYCNKTGSFRSLYLESQCLEILSIIGMRSLLDSESNELTIEEIDKLHQARSILSKRFNSPPTLTELSREVGINTFALKRGFKQIFGKPPFKWLSEFRMSLAYNKLATKEVTVTEIAEYIGYANPNVFSNAFMRHYGLRPSQLRKKLPSE